MTLGITGGAAQEDDVVVDVGMPAYGGAEYLAEAIESVLAQTFTRWRLAICENGPGGGPIAEAARPYLADPRVRYLATGTELPMADNWTNALHQGSAPYVALFHDDDRWHPDFLANRVWALETHPACGFAYAQFVEIDGQGRQTWWAPVENEEGVLDQSTLAGILTRSNPIVPPAIVVRRSAYEAVGAAFDPQWHYCDWEMWARLAARFPAYYLARHDNDYRRHPLANTYARREDPAVLLAMIDRLESVFAAELPEFRLDHRDRSHNRSHILLQSAWDVHQVGGWRRSGPLYRAALRQFPLAVLDRMSLDMVAGSVLGRRGSEATASVLRHLRRTTGESGTSGVA